MTTWNVHISSKQYIKTRERYRYRKVVLGHVDHLLEVHRLLHLETRVRQGKLLIRKDHIYGVILVVVRVLHSGVFWKNVNEYERISLQAYARSFAFVRCILPYPGESLSALQLCRGEGSILRHRVEQSHEDVARRQGRKGGERNLVVIIMGWRWEGPKPPLKRGVHQRLRSLYRVVKNGWNEKMGDRKFTNSLKIFNFLRGGNWRGKSARNWSNRIGKVQFVKSQCVS